MKKHRPFHSKPTFDSTEMATKKYNPKNFWSVFRRVQIALWSFVLFVVLFFIGVNYGLLGEMPDLDAIQKSAE